MKELNQCVLCPNYCKVNRIKGQKGKCKSGADIEIALCTAHSYEEPCISGTNGSGTVFFTNCNMHCVYCQNYKISQLGKGKIINIEELATCFLQLQNQGVHNINLVTPTPHIIQIKKAIEIAKNNGLILPIIYNSGGYETVETIQRLKGYIDVYLPDLKYAENELGEKYSGVKNYFFYATQSILEMQKQVGAPILNAQGLIQKGLIVRHLVIPGHVENTKKVLLWMKENLLPEVFISIMAQYFPCYKAKTQESLNRKITSREYKKIEEYIYNLNFLNGYIQEPEDDEEKYVPQF